MSYDYLYNHDSDLRHIYHRYGEPPTWQREPGFATLVQIILEQQVSLASAQATFTKLENVIGVTPKTIVDLNDDRLKAFGLSRQKSRYIKSLAQAIIDGLDLNKLHQQDDITIREELIKLPGIGHWTIDIYLLMALNKPDIFPTGDLALRVAVQEVKGLKVLPNAEQLLEIAKLWQPYRSYASKLLWHYYLSQKN
jgi:DNA-3-methyladenine glycosylase II